MKTVYIPRGETVHYETLVTDHLVVKGYLDVTYGVKAKTISGSGVICAGSAAAGSCDVLGTGGSAGLGSGSVVPVSAGCAGGSCCCACSGSSCCSGCTDAGGSGDMGSGCTIAARDGSGGSSSGATVSGRMVFALVRHTLLSIMTAAMPAMARARVDLRNLAICRSRSFRLCLPFTIPSRRGRAGGEAIWCRVSSSDSP